MEIRDIREIKKNDNCRKETLNHIEKVQHFMSIISALIDHTKFYHDKSKLESPEFEVFAEYTSKLATTTYGSDEYKQFLKEMEPALKHHYSVNRHHPEHFENGIKDMNLVDLIEMICDWNAAAQRHNDGDVLKSIEINQNRFGYSDELKQILINTIKLFEE